jgi:hypothetical protein
MLNSIAVSALLATSISSRIQERRQRMGISLSSALFTTGLVPRTRDTRPKSAQPFGLGRCRRLAALLARDESVWAWRVCRFGIGRIVRFTVVSYQAEEEVPKIMKIGFVSLYGPGHFNPMSAVARQLQSRNHDAVMLSLSFVEPLARAANLPFIPFGEKEFSAEVFQFVGNSILKSGCLVSVHYCANK